MDESIEGIALPLNACKKNKQEHSRKGEYREDESILETCSSKNVCTEGSNGITRLGLRMDEKINKERVERAS